MPFNSDWFNKMERRFGRYAIRNLMLYIVTAMGVVFIVDYLPFAGQSVASWLIFSRDLILKGQFWRLFTFAFLPPNTSLLFLIFSLYFYWLIGSSLENRWGAFKFNLFYLCGLIGTILSGMITGFATNAYLNLSLFFAFAILYPNFELMIFFMLPVKIKYLAYISAAFFLYSLITASWADKLALIVALINLILFFWRDFMVIINNINRRRQFRDAWKR
jgi:Predicted membrane protein